MLPGKVLATSNVNGGCSARAPDSAKVARATAIDNPDLDIGPSFPLFEETQNAVSKPYGVAMPGLGRTLSAYSFIKGTAARLAALVFLKHSLWFAPA